MTNVAAAWIAIVVAFYWIVVALNVVISIYATYMEWYRRERRTVVIIGILVNVIVLCIMTDYQKLVIAHSGIPTLYWSFSFTHLLSKLLCCVVEDVFGLHRQD
jgi:hypothetical protein